MINVRQIRAARAWLAMSQEELADAAGVARRTVIRLEGPEGRPSALVVQKLQDALEKKGAVFIVEDGRGTGVRFVERAVRPRRRLRK
jgi:DNA-binding XRE family transcriptional regulator